MALKAHTRTEAFDAFKALVVAAVPSGTAYYDRIRIEDVPSTRADYFIIGARITKPLNERRERQQDNDLSIMETRCPVLVALRQKPNDREGKRNEWDTIADALHQGCTSNTAGLEARWLGESEELSANGEWLIIRGQAAYRYLFDLGAP
ncbi:MAG: hypothetical protein GY871_06680 [Actinomycetales bacterium]|nr:hypothetical protein [Actinomycetales bacterium]